MKVVTLRSFQYENSVTNKCTVLIRGAFLLVKLSTESTFHFYSQADNVRNNVNCISTKHVQFDELIQKSIARVPLVWPFSKAWCSILCHFQRDMEFLNLQYNLNATNAYMLLKSIKLFSRKINTQIWRRKKIKAFEGGLLVWTQWSSRYTFSVYRHIYRYFLNSSNCYKCVSGVLHRNSFVSGSRDWWWYG